MALPAAWASCDYASGVAGSGDLGDIVDQPDTILLREDDVDRIALAIARIVLFDSANASVVEHDHIGERQKDLVVTNRDGGREQPFEEARQLIHRHLALGSEELGSFVGHQRKLPSKVVGIAAPDHLPQRRIDRGDHLIVCWRPGGKRAGRDLGIRYVVARVPDCGHVFGGARCDDALRRIDRNRRRILCQGRYMTAQQQRAADGKCRQCSTEFAHGVLHFMVRQIWPSSAAVDPRDVSFWFTGATSRRRRQQSHRPGTSSRFDPTPFHGRSAARPCPAVTRRPITRGHASPYDVRHRSPFAGTGPAATALRVLRSRPWLPSPRASRTLPRTDPPRP